MRGKLLTFAVLSTAAAMACGGDDNANPATGSGGSAGSGGGSTTTMGTGGTGGGGTGGSDGGTSMPVTQPGLDAIGANTQVTFTVIENVPMVATDAGMMADCPASTGGFCLDAKITLKNMGPAWNATGWAIYYSSIRKVAWVGNPDFTITHIVGDLHKIEPTASFKGFAM